MILIRYFYTKFLEAGRCVVSRKFQKKKLKKRFFYPSDLVNTKTTIPLRVGEEWRIYILTLRVSVYIHHYSPPLRGIVVYYFRVMGGVVQKPEMACN